MPCDLEPKNPFSIGANQSCIDHLEFLAYVQFHELCERVRAVPGREVEQCFGEARLFHFCKTRLCRNSAKHGEPPGRYSIRGIAFLPIDGDRAASVLPEADRQPNYQMHSDQKSRQAVRENGEKKKSHEGE
ncbi:hypothetical protein CgunFtcFv8_027458 [Champsocephalus gunnari]|uniref:Uncharacterized protein n=1 Tax=Champsocephalus gunnari TaxID=52237 RepID=A0AAN8HXD1_CHAGU|nr:hypothetical protein CgunFtcFv8_027458 [Champsocephalus gunnari]